MKNKNKILIAGGAGYIGGYLTDILKEDYQVTVYDNLMYEKKYLKDIHFVNGDIRDKKKIKKVVDENDVIIWLAAIVGDGACSVDTKLTEEINEHSVKWLVDHCDRNKKIIFMSTCSIYGINDGVLKEETEPNPLSTYAKTKLSSEQYIVDNFPNHLVFRLGTLFGIGDCFSRPRLDLVVNILTKRATEKLPLHVFGGEQWRPLMHVKDVGHAIKKALEEKIVGLYNVSMNNYRMRDLAIEIAKIIPNTEIEYQDIPSEDFRNYKVNNQKFLSVCSWRPSLALEFGIREIQTLISENRIIDPEDFTYSNAKYTRHKYV